MFCLTVCIYVLQVFFLYVCLLIFIYCIYVVRFLLEERKRAICFIESDQFTSSCTWKYQGSYSNQHGYIIKKKVLKECTGLRFEIQQLIE